MSDDSSVKARDRCERNAHRYKWHTLLPIVVTLVAAGCSGDTSKPTQAQIAFASERDGNPEIYVVKDDGTGLTRLTDDPADDVEPAWSP